MAQAILMSSITRAIGLLGIVLPRSPVCTAIMVVLLSAAVQVPWQLEQAAAGLAAACPLQLEEEEEAAPGLTST